jgi:CBS domain-containing protein
MRVGDLTQTNLVTAAPDECLADAALRMCENGVGSLAITDGDSLAGVLTERDVLTAVADGAASEITPVSDYMSDEPLVAAPDLELDEAVALMVEHGIRHLPVVRHGVPVGMISARDVLEARDREHRAAG